MTISIDSDELLKILKDFPLTKQELRRILIKETRAFYAKEQQVIGRGWGIRTGRLSREGLKMGVDRKSEQRGGAAYRVYFSKKKGQRGTPEYMADTFKARWLEGGTKQHYTAKGATIKKAKKGRLSLNSHQRKLRHPGITSRPIIKNLVNQYSAGLIANVRKEVEKLLIKKGATGDR